jgi:hypothetical protein
VGGLSTAWEQQCLRLHWAHKEAPFSTAQRQHMHTSASCFVACRLPCHSSAAFHTSCRVCPTLCLPAVLVEVLQDACALLECRQPLELGAAIKPVQDLAALVPRMERFIGDTCGVRLRDVGEVPARHARQRCACSTAH